ncbi:DUF4197 domain-containing protein [Vibrio sp. RC27]
MKKVAIVSSLLLCSTFSHGFDLKSVAESVVSKVSESSDSTSESSATDSSSSSDLSNSTVSSAVKEALTLGVDYAVTSLGADDGYLNNDLVKIALPENLQSVESLIRKAGGDEIADNLINSMNSAATKAAPETASIFVDAINNMSLDDAKAILNGGDNAATEYFSANTTDSLTSLVSPIIQETMEENKVAEYYDTFNDYYKEYGSELVESANVSSLAKSLGVDSYIPSSSDQNLDEYVTEQAIDGLFTMIAEKEASIRQDPIAQTTSLLQSVFGD